MPTVSSGANGSGSATSTVDYYDDYGRLRWQIDALGYVNYYSYHPENGQQAYRLRDADPTSLPTSADSNSAQYAVDPDRTAQSSGVPTGLSASTGQSYYLRWTRRTYGATSGQLTTTWTYHDIPSSGDGSKDTNYVETVFGYDAQGRRDRQVAPGGTITRTVFDNLGRVASQWVGTDDTPSSGSWSPSNNSGADMTKVAEFEYDEDSAGGNGNRTKAIAYLTDVVEDYTQPDVKLNYDSGTAGAYAGLDRFGRVVDQLWHDYGASANRDEFTYGYDRASNRLYRENTSTSGQDDYYTSTTAWHAA